MKRKEDFPHLLPLKEAGEGNAIFFSLVSPTSVKNEWNMCDDITHRLTPFMFALLQLAQRKREMRENFPHLFPLKKEVRENFPHLNFVLHHFFVFQHQRSISICDDEAHAMELISSLQELLITRKFEQCEKSCDFPFLGASDSKKETLFVLRKLAPNMRNHTNKSMVTFSMYFCID